MTDGLVASISNGSDFRIVGTFVESQMRWVVVIKYDSQFQSVIDLKGKTFGITRFGVGSHINTVLLAKNQGWLVSQNEEQGNNIRIKPVGDLNSLVNAIRKGIIDCFI